MGQGSWDGLSSQDAFSTPHTPSKAAIKFSEFHNQLKAVVGSEQIKIQFAKIWRPDLSVDEHETVVPVAQLVGPVDAILAVLPQVEECESLQ